MPGSYPNDADGAALRGVVDSGADMSRPMVIDFSFEVPDEDAARRVADVVVAHGFDPSISEDGGSWSVHCSKSMLATYEGVVAVQVELKELLSQYGATCQGWGTFGNT